ncbi:MAG: hypothetical protein ACJAU0_000131 [Flavobacteriales bacterium]|jgi:hypothetical protein
MFKKRMHITYFKKLAIQETLLNSNVHPMAAYKPEGCSVVEIDALEVKMKVKFPQAYREYLFLMGEEHKLYWSGVEFSFSVMEELQEQALAVLEEEGYSLEHPFWVINALGYDQFHFFYFKDGDDPPVYHWLGSDEKTYEGYSNGMAKTADYFSAFIKEMLPTRGERFINSWMKRTGKLRKMFSRF